MGSASLEHCVLCALCDDFQNKFWSIPSRQTKKISFLKQANENNKDEKSEIQQNIYHMHKVTENKKGTLNTAEKICSKLENDELIGFNVIRTRKNENKIERNQYETVCMQTYTTRMAYL